MYKPEDIPPAIMEPPSGSAPLYVQRVFEISGGAVRNMTEEQIKLYRTSYYAKITLIDECIGRITKALEERGLLENTWIFYSSDHGEMLCDHWLLHKAVFYEGALRIPCIVRPPKGVKGWTSSALCDHLDQAASLIDIAGAEPLAGSDGRSLIAKVSEGPDGPEAQRGKEVVFSEVVGFSMARNQRYKMAVNAETHEPVELYDIEDDPNELRNLANESSFEGVRRELLDEHLSRLLSRLDKEKLKTFKETSRDFWDRQSIDK